MSYTYRKQDKQRTITLVVAAIFIVGVLWFLFIAPAISGFLIYQKASEDNKTAGDYLRGIDNIKDEFNTRIGGLESNISSCYNLGNELTVKLGNCNKDLADCLVDINKINSTYTGLLKECESESEKINQTGSKEIESLRNQLTQKSEDYASLANNTARSICCKAKVDNSDIKFYKIENNKLVCSEDSGIALNCM